LIRACRDAAIGLLLMLAAALAVTAASAWVLWWGILGIEGG